MGRHIPIPTALRGLLDHQMKLTETTHLAHLSTRVFSNLAPKWGSHLGSKSFSIHLLLSVGTGKSHSFHSSSHTNNIFEQTRTTNLFFLAWKCFHMTNEILNHILVDHRRTYFVFLPWVSPAHTHTHHLYFVCLFNHHISHQKRSHRPCTQPQ
jgi:hypothetical protein